MKREVLADLGIWTGKKHYILNVHNSEGVQYEEPKLKIMGIEAVKSSTPEHCRNALKKAFKIVVNGTEGEVIDFIENFKNEFKQLEPEEVAFPRSVKGLAKYKDPVTIYRKSTPLHGKGSLIYNMMLDKNKLTKKYPRIQEGEKIKYTYLICIRILSKHTNKYNNFIYFFWHNILFVRLNWLCYVFLATYRLSLLYLY